MQLPVYPPFYLFLVCVRSVPHVPHLPVLELTVSSPRLASRRLSHFPVFFFSMQCRDRALRLERWHAGEARNSLLQLPCYWRTLGMVLCCHVLSIRADGRKRLALQFQFAAPAMARDRKSVV